MLVRVFVELDDDVVDRMQLRELENVAGGKRAWASDKGNVHLTYDVNGNTLVFTHAEQGHRNHVRPFTFPLRPLRNPPGVVKVVDPRPERRYNNGGVGGSARGGPASMEA